MSEKPIIDVLVVGAGPVGLTLAIDLTRRGVTCRIIEQSPTYQIGTRGRGISMRSQQVFEDLGILEALLPYDEGMPPTRNYDHDILVNVTNPSLAAPPVPPPYRPFLMINQEHTEAVLRERLASFGRQVELARNWSASPRRRRSLLQTSRTQVRTRRSTLATWWGAMEAIAQCVKPLISRSWAKPGTRSIFSWPTFR